MVKKLFSEKEYSSFPFFFIQGDAKSWADIIKSNYIFLFLEYIRN